MKQYSNILYGLLTSLLVLVMPIVTSSCSDDDEVRSGGLSDKGVNLIVSVEGLGASHLSRAESERTDQNRIDNMNVVLADGSGRIEQILYADNETEANTNPGMDESGLVQGTLPNEGGGNLYFHIGSGDASGVSEIYVVCNYRSTGATTDDGDLNNVLKIGESTVSDLKSLTQGTTFSGYEPTTTLFGKAEPTGEQDMHGGNEYNVELKRTTAMITVSITADGLKDGVRITPRSMRLCNVPKSCHIGSDNVAGNDGIEVRADGLEQGLSWGTLTSDGNPITVGGHDNDETVTPLFMFENMQGVMDNTVGSTQDEREETKKPNAGKEDVCSYLEITADYLYINPGVNNISGTIKYRLYLGEDIWTDFNVERNKHYQVKLTLKGMGGLVEDGKTDENGKWIWNGQGEDVKWRIDGTDLTNTAAFVGDGIDMSSNGYTAYIPFVAEEGKNYYIYCPNGNSESWLKSDLQNGGNFGTPTEDYGFYAVVYPYTEVPGGVPGLSYVRIVATAWSYGDWKKWAEGDITTIENFINNGYRKDILALKDNQGNIVDEFEVRQWLPMPIMEPDVLDGSENPLDAELFFSRIDVYDGELIRWGPEFYDNLNASDVDMSNFYITNGRDANPDYGFDLCAELFFRDFNMNRYAFENFDSSVFGGDSGKPSSAIAVAIYRAGNMSGDEKTTSDPIRFQNTGLQYVGLPSVPDWNKIIQYGVFDPRFLPADVPYWTSSMSGTQSYVFYPYENDSELKNRAELHRARLIYHRKDVAFAQ